MAGPDAPAGPRPKPGVLDIIAYSPGKASAEGVAEPVKLSANENILGCSEAARRAFADAAASLNAYPDGRAGRLRAAVAERYGVEPDRLVFGCGTDEIFHLICQAHLEPGDNIAQGAFGFGAYAIAAAACQAEVRRAPEPGLRIDADALLEAVDDRTRIVFVANPGNPTGTAVSGADIRRLHAGLRPDILLVLDGAYAEFASDPGFEDGIALARSAPNVVVTRTFSKIHGLAAARVGWAYAPLATADALDRIRLPFNVSSAAQAAALAALADTEFEARSRRHVETWRPWLTQQLGGLGLEVAPSEANFLLARFPREAGRSAEAAEAYLASQGYLVRGVGAYGLPDHLRITIGLEAHNRDLVRLLAAFLGQGDRA